MKFEWDPAKDALNLEKHGVSFGGAQLAFLDPRRIVASDTAHSSPDEVRYFLFGSTPGGILTVRFTVRKNRIRIIGAGYWREGRRRYEQENNL
jgi:uncharacterized DUF497 family protein